MKELLKDWRGRIILLELLVIAPAVPFTAASPTTKGVTGLVSPPPCRIVIFPPLLPTAVEILASTPF